MAWPRSCSATWSRRCWHWSWPRERSSAPRRRATAGLQPRRRGPARGEREVAIEVDGPPHFCGRTPTGATALKRRQLRAAGWALLPVPYWECGTPSAAARRPNRSISGGPLSRGRSHLQSAKRALSVLSIDSHVYRIREETRTRSHMGAPFCVGLYTVATYSIELANLERANLARAVGPCPYAMGRYSDIPYVIATSSI